MMTLMSITSLNIFLLIFMFYPYTYRIHNFLRMTNKRMLDGDDRMNCLSASKKVKSLELEIHEACEKETPRKLWSSSMVTHR